LQQLWFGLDISSDMLQVGAPHALLLNVEC
jgi:hypothetical protein